MYYCNGRKKVKMLRRKQISPSLEKVRSYEVISKRKFLGKWYKWETSYSQKKEAKEHKARLKKQGKLIRMIKTGDGLYALYIRNK